MRENLRGALWRLAVYAVVCVLGAFALIAVFAQLRFQSEKTYTAQFTNVSGLEGGNFVRIAGVEVGKVKNISIQPDSTVVVEFTAADSVMLTEGTRAAIRFADLVGGRYVALEEGAGGVKRLHPGATIPLSRTEPALDLDALIGGFRPLFRALDPVQVNKLTGQLIAAFQGQGATIGSFLSQAAALTNTLADRDQLIGQVVVNLNSVLGSLSGQSTQLAKTVDSLAELVEGLNARKKDISNGVALRQRSGGVNRRPASAGSPTTEKGCARGGSNGRQRFWPITITSTTSSTPGPTRPKYSTGRACTATSSASISAKSW